MVYDSPAGGMTTPAASSRPLSTRATPPQQNVAAPNPADEVLVTGSVMKRGGRLNRWKSKHASLSRGFANFQLRLSDDEASRKKPTVFVLTLFRSTFEPTKEFSNYPHAFKIKTDKLDKNSQELILAVKTEKEFNLWLVGLHEAVNGSGSPAGPKGAPPVTSIQFSPHADTEPVSQLNNNAYDFPASSSDNDSDLEAALAESLRLSQEGHSPQQQSMQQQSVDLAADSKPPATRYEEAKEEIRDQSESERDLKAALAESLLVSETSV